MHHLNLFQISQRVKYLDRKGPYIRHIQRRKAIGLQQLIQAHGEQLSDYTDVFFEHDEVLDAENVFLVLDIFLLGLHEDVDLVEGQLHVLLF